MAFALHRVTNRKLSLQAAKKHTLAQGEVVHAANLLQDAFFALFRLALSLERPDEFAAQARFYNHALAIWHIIQADGLQRDMALAAISTVPTSLKLDRAIKGLAWAKRRADRLAAYRNLIAHSPVMFQYAEKGKRRGLFPVFGGHSLRPVHKTRLDLIEGLGFWQMLRDDLLRLTAYVDGVTFWIAEMDAQSHDTELLGSPGAWPRRPRLPSFARLLAIEAQLEQAARRAKRPRRRRPSRA
jgi:hypothetical protein